MTLTIDNAYNSKIISNNDASIDIVDVESRKLLFVGAIVVVTEGPKAGVWAVIKVNPRSVQCCSLLQADGTPSPAAENSVHKISIPDSLLKATTTHILPAGMGGRFNQGFPTHPHLSRGKKSDGQSMDEYGLDITRQA